MSETIAIFDPGSLVRLKSGGPAMTVEKTGRFGGQIRVSAVWFEGLESRRAMFAPETLIPAEPGP